MSNGLPRPGLRAKVSRHPHVLAAVLFAIALGGIYFSVLTGDRSLITNGSLPRGPLFVGDPTAGGAITLPLERLASVSWSHLALPIIDPYQGYGIPLLADQGVPVYLPQLLVHFLVPNNYSVWIVLNLMAIAFGSYLLARSFGQRFLAAVAVGFAASLAGVAPPNLNMAMLNPFAVLPFVLVAIRFSVDPDSKHRPAALLGVATSVAFLCLSGFQEVLPLMAVVIVVYAIGMVVHYQSLRFGPRLIGLTVVSGLVGGLIGSVGLLPTLSIVRSDSSLNGPGAYALHAPLYWLSTLTIPSLTERATAAQPQDLGQTVWTIGSPLLVLVVVLSLLMVLRRQGRHLRWYGWPSIIFVVYGVLGYANLLHVLRLFDVSPFNSIITLRFLQFAWWIPWCLLLGMVISNARLVRRVDALVAVLVTGLFDLFFVAKFRDALIGQNLSRFLDDTRRATILAVVIVLVFVAAALISRWIGGRASAAIMSAVVVGSCLYYLPTNFFPKPSDQAVSTVRILGTSPPRGAYLAFLGTAQLPTNYYSVQIFGPIIPRPYQAIVTALFSGSDTNGYGPLYDGVPTLGFATMNSRLVDILGTLGTDTLISATALPVSTFGPIPPCGGPVPVGAQATLCYLGRSANVGGPPTPRGFAYAILGATPLVSNVANTVTVPSDQIGLNAMVGRLAHQSDALSTTAYITSSGPRLTAARGVVGLSRAATTQTVSVSLRSQTAGEAVLRQTYMPGMRASVNGRSVPALPVNGGLWTAVAVNGGASQVVLDYASPSDLVEFGIAAAGMLALALAWVALAVTSRRRRARGQDGEAAAPIK